MCPSNKTTCPSLVPQIGLEPPLNWTPSHCFALKRKSFMVLWSVFPHHKLKSLFIWISICWMFRRKWQVCDKPAVTHNIDWFNGSISVTSLEGLRHKSKAECLWMWTLCDDCNPTLLWGHGVLPGCCGRGGPAGGVWSVECVWLQLYQGSLWADTQTLCSFGSHWSGTGDSVCYSSTHSLVSLGELAPDGQ